MNDRGLRSARAARGALHLRALLMVALGGAAGALARDYVSRRFGTSPNGFPSATLAVNVTGALLLGFFHSAILPAKPALRPFVAIGLLGSFTTFSGFAVGVVDLARLDQPATAVTYLALTVTCGVAAAWAGMRLGSLIEPTSERQT